jgi:hypothetical protein
MQEVGSQPRIGHLGVGGGGLLTGARLVSPFEHEASVGDGIEPLGDREREPRNDERQVVSADGLGGPGTAQELRDCKG